MFSLISQIQFSLYFVKLHARVYLKLGKVISQKVGLKKCHSHTNIFGQPFALYKKKSHVASVRSSGAQVLVNND